MRVAPIIVVSALTVALAACGVRGSLEPPTGARTQTTATADSGQGKPAGAASKPHESFILDGLLR